MINLVPGKYKAILAQEARQINIFKWQIFSICVLTVALVGLGLLYYSLTMELKLDQTILSVINDETTAVRELQSNIKGLNTRALEVKGILESREYQEEIVKKIASSIPEDVILSSLSVDKQEENYLITIRGFANDSDALYVLKGNLENSEYFQNVEFPLSNLIEEEDIDFSVSFIYEQQ